MLFLVLLNDLFGIIMVKSKGPAFLVYMNPILEVLKELGGSGNSSEIQDLVIEKLNIPDEKLEEKLKSGASRVKNQIAWARIYLVKDTLLDDSSKRGIWTLTEKGQKTNLTYNDSIKLFKKVQSTFTTKKTNDNGINDTVKIVPADNTTESNEENTFENELLDILKSLSPSGFERICQRLLRESGFKKVLVTGKTGDGGIDGEGILEINPLISFKVLFQAKRYQGTVGATIIRDFRGAMLGRADKGIIITTGNFSRDAKKEAIRDGAPPIELVDGQLLVELFRKNELGIKPKIVFEINKDFFDEFMD